MAHGSGVRVGLLEGPIRGYAWGSRHAIATLQGRPAPTPTPEAELWLGAHPADPARVVGAAAPVALDAAISEDPLFWLGEPALRAFGPRLPFLLKVLAVDQPLSLQVHPDTEHAREGFAAEEARGVPIDAPGRTYRDAWPKPELLCALTDMDALCGFRRAESTVDLLARLTVPALDPLVADLTSRGDAALADTVGRLLRWPDDHRGPLVSEVVGAARRVVAEARGHAPILAELVDLGARYPADPGVVVAAMLHLVHLRPGEAIHLPAGHLHAYLRGAGVEIMASSDNVVRGGLTPKHVAVDELLRVLLPESIPSVRVPAVAITGGHAYPVDVPYFALERLDPGDAVLSLERGGPEILLACGGAATVTADGNTLALRAGQAAVVPAATQTLALAGEGPVFRATVGDVARR